MMNKMNGTTYDLVDENLSTIQGLIMSRFQELKKQGMNGKAAHFRAVADTADLVRPTQSTSALKSWIATTRAKLYPRYSKVKKTDRAPVDFQFKVVAPKTRRQTHDQSSFRDVIARLEPGFSAEFKFANGVTLRGQQIQACRAAKNMGFVVRTRIQNDKLIVERL